jgi:hypothetical protein
MEDPTGHHGYPSIIPIMNILIYVEGNNGLGLRDLVIRAAGEMWKSDPNPFPLIEFILNIPNFRPKKHTHIDR